MTAVTDTPEGPNIRELESKKSTRITTLKQLLKFCKVDQKVWEVERHTLNKWEVGMKGPDGGVVVEPLFQVKATLKRRVLKAQHPTIRPIEINAPSINTFKQPHGNSTGIRRVLVLPDPQFGFYKDLRTGELEPFHDRRALDLAVQVSYSIRPHYIVCLGDILDLADWSDKFPRTPDMEQTTQPAVIEASWWLGRLRQSSTRAVMNLLEGNHDKRMELAIVNHLKAAYGLRPADELALPPSLSIPRLLALHKIGCNYSDAYPNGQFWLTDNFVFEHGDTVRGGSGNTASAIVNKSDVSVMSGHIHRIEQALRTKSDGTTIGAYSPGCLCRVDGAVPGRKKRQNWQQGLSMIHFEPDTNHMHVQLVEIKDGTALINGKVFAGEDRASELREDTGWRF